MAVAAIGAGDASAQAAVAVGELRCEYLTNPLGIDARQPRLSWILTSDERGERQTAYQVLVASSTPEKLDARRRATCGTAAASSPTVDRSCRYAGKPLGSHGACFWKVRVWDADGEPSPWSEPARWSMGAARTRATGRRSGSASTEASRRSICTDTNWIWFPEGNPAEAVPVATRYFRRAIDAAGGSQGDEGDPADRGRRLAA